MISIEQWRAKIGSFSCRGEPEEEEYAAANRLWRCMYWEPPGYSERYKKHCGTSAEEDLVKSANHKTVIEDDLIKGGIEPNPGPGLYEMVSVLYTMRVCS